MKNKEWTEEEISFVKDNYLTMMVKDIATQLDRSFHATKHMIKKLNLSGKNGKWTDAEKQFLRDNLEMPLKEMSVILKKSVANIKSQHRRLGISKYTKNTTRYPEIYHTYLGMKSRCFNKDNQAYENYGERGITVCDAWVKSFEVFLSWSLENGWKKDLSLDRIDNNGPYPPENCRWTTELVQANNRRTNAYLTAFGETKTLSEWIRDDRCKVTYNVLIRRYNQKDMSPEEMMTRPKFEPKKITAWGETKTLPEWANDDRCVVSESRIYKRLKRGMSPEQAISEKNW